MVAIKELRAERKQDSEDVQRFQREATVSSHLDSPFVVKLYEYRELGGRGLLVMEYVPGPSVASRMEQSPISVSEALAIATDLAEALVALGALGVVHRDVKPSNVLLSADGTAKLTDFGIAKVRDGRELTQSGFGMGSLPYVAPEQATSSRDVSQLTDIYSLGATLYAMIGGQAPFSFKGEKGILQKLKRVVEGSPPELGSLRPDCPAEVCELVAELMSKSPDDRPPAAAAVRDRLNAIRKRLYPGQFRRMKSASDAVARSMTVRRPRGNDGV
jgi:serine/threonine-protein kinase